MGLLTSGANKPKKATDWAKTGSIAFVVALIGVIFAGRFVEGFPLNAKTLIFIVLIGVGLFVGLKFLRFASPTQQLSIEDAGLFIAVLAGIVWIIKEFDISPSFSLVAQNIASVVGLG